MLAWGPLALDRRRRTATLEERTLALTSREFDVLLMLVESGGATVSREELFQRIGERSIPGSNIVEVCVRRLRAKLGDDAAIVETVRGTGYRLRRF
jgi:DNA-binding response OmpR family regulator